MADINKYNVSEETLIMRKNNKGELYRIEGLLFYLEKALKDGSIKTENKETSVLLNNIASYLGERHKTISDLEKKLDDELKEKSEQDLPKYFM